MFVKQSFQSSLTDLTSVFPPNTQSHVRSCNIHNYKMFFIIKRISS